MRAGTISASGTYSSLSQHCCVHRKVRLFTPFFFSKWISWRSMNQQNTTKAQQKIHQQELIGTVSVWCLAIVLLLMSHLLVGNFCMSKFLFALLSMSWMHMIGRLGGVLSCCSNHLAGTWLLWHVYSFNLYSLWSRYWGYSKSLLIWSWKDWKNVWITEWHQKSWQGPLASW